MLLDASRTVLFARESKGIGEESEGIGEKSKWMTGTLIAYATSEGGIAWGLGGDTHSLFTKHLLKYLQEPIEINQVLTRVRAAVAQEADQWPEALSGLTKDLYLVEPLTVRAAARSR